MNVHFTLIPNHEGGHKALLEELKEAIATIRGRIDVVVIRIPQETLNRRTREYGKQILAEDVFAEQVQLYMSELKDKHPVVFIDLLHEFIHIENPCQEKEACSNFFIIHHDDEKFRVIQIPGQGEPKLVEIII